MKFAIQPKKWPPVIEALRKEGLEQVELSGNPELFVFNGAADNFPPLPDSVKWVQFTLAGIDAFLDRGIIDSSRLFSNASGIYARPVAESAVALLLSVLHLHPKVARSHAWDTTGTIDRDTRWLYDTSVAVVGAGGIGRELVPMLKGFGCQVVAVNRSGKPVEGADRTVTDEALIDTLKEVDHVIAAAPLTEATAGMFDARAFAAMGDKAVFVNVGRGPLVKTHDLVEALEKGVIAGAGLDVTDPEPLPKENPLWDMDNVIITPHVANTATQTPYLLAGAIIDNLRAYRAGTTMPTAVDPNRGY